MIENKLQDPYYYEDVIDLRELIKTLLKCKWIIVSVTLLAAVVAFLTSKFIISPQYEVATRVGIRQPSFVLNLEPNINNPSPLEDDRQLTEITKGLPQLAETADVWLSVCEEMNLICLREGNQKPELEAALVGTSQLILTVTSSNPEILTEFANLWAEEVIKRWDMIYDIEKIQISQLEEEVARASDIWDSAQNALEDYLPESQINVVEVQLNQAKQILANYLSEIEGNESIIRDADSLDTRLGKQDQSSKLLIGDALSLVGLLQRSTGGVSGTQFQVTGTDIYGQEYTISEARKTLADLVSALDDQNNQLEMKFVDLEVMIAQLTLGKEAEQSRITRLEEERDRALNNYHVLARYLDETLIAAGAENQAIYSISKAGVPLEGESNTLKNTALASLVGLMISVGGVFVYSWWISEEENV